MMRRFGLAHDPEKWEPVSDKIVRTKIWGAAGCALGWMGQRDDAENRNRIGGRSWHAHAAV
jgi:hypothetical protein